MRNRDNNSGWMIACAVVLPFLIFYAVYEVVATILQLVWQSLLAGTSDHARLEAMMTNLPWVSAMITAAAMTVALLCVLRTAVGEIKAFTNRADREGRRLSSNGMICLLFFFVALCMDLGLNTLFSVTGFSSLAGSAGEVQRNIALTWGVAVYGVLTPLIEEIVFRGAVFARMVRLLDYRAGRQESNGQEGTTVPLEAGLQTGERPDQKTAGDPYRNFDRQKEEQRRRRTILESMVFSSILFALWHNNLPQGILGFCLGMVLSGLYAYSGIFALPVFLHGLLNIFMLVLSYTGVYNTLCSSAWCAAFLALALGGSICLVQILRREDGKA